MTRFLLFLILFFSPFTGDAQLLSQNISKAYQKLIADNQAKNAIVSLCVLNAETGKTIFAKNEQIGLATASTLKIITSATAFYLLGTDFRYETKITYTGKIDEQGILKGDIIINGSGDPTLGSLRFEYTKPDYILNEWLSAIQKLGIKQVEGRIIADERSFSSATIPLGWIWQDIGNYYGAGGGAICWRENQFDIKLKPGKKLGDSVEISEAENTMLAIKLVNELKTGAIATGDRAYAFLAPYTSLAYLRGTWGMGIQKTGIALANPDPALDLALQLQNRLQKSHINCSQPAITSRLLGQNNQNIAVNRVNIYSTFSPKLSEIIHWFNKKSINLYGEQLLKTMALQQGLEANTVNGVKTVIDFWGQRGIDKTALNIIDGSGLSPGNRVSTAAMATILFQAQHEPWFKSYINSFPSYNGMTLKSGNINDVTAYAGYYVNAQGEKFVVVININNYNGAKISSKLFQVLDVLK